MKEIILLFEIIYIFAPANTVLVDYGVMVTLQILVLIFLVRVQVGQQTFVYYTKEPQTTTDLVVDSDYTCFPFLDHVNLK